MSRRWKWYCFIGLLLKAVGAISLGLVYKYYYTEGDTFSLFADGKLLAQLATSKPDVYLKIIWESCKGNTISEFIALANPNPRAVSMALVDSIFSLLTGGNYWLSAIDISILNFLGILLLLLTLEKIFKVSHFILSLSFFYYPSVLFWSSGLLKENILLATLAISLAIILRLVHQKSFPKISFFKKAIYTVILSFALLLMLRLKYYYFAVFIPVIIAYISILLYRNKTLQYPSANENQLSIAFNYKREAVLFTAIFIISIFLATRLHPNLYLGKVINALVLNHDLMVKDSAHPENLIFYNGLQPTFLAILKNIPKAFWEGLLRPYIWENGNVLKRIMALENTFFIGLLLTGIYRWRKACFPLKYPLEIQAIIFFSLVLLVMLAISAPNLGNLVRYKAGFMPFLLLLLFSAANSKE